MKGELSEARFHVVLAFFELLRLWISDDGVIALPSNRLTGFLPPPILLADERCRYQAFCL